MKTKSVLLLSTLATAALLLIAAFTFLAAFSLTTGLTLAAPPDAPGPASVATTMGLAPLGPSSVTLTRSPTSVLADGTSTITATVKDELDSFSNGSPTLSATAVYTVEAESSEVITVGTWSTYSESACNASNGQVIFSGDTNDKVSYTFTGTQVTVLYQKQSNTGFMDVLVDGLLRQQVDTYYGGGGKQCQQAVVVSNLPWGPHTVEAVVVGDKNPSSSDNSIVVDAFTIVTDIFTGCEDAYEPDNDFTTAVTVTLPSFTSHNFDFAGDQDWVRFWGYEGITYTLETMNLAISGTQTVDTELGLYWWDGSDLVELATDKDSGLGRAALIVWPITTTGWYYVNMGRAEAAWSFSGCDATYDLSVTSTGPPCTMTLVIEPDTLLVGNTATMTATVVDCSDSPLAGQVITFSTTSDLGSGGISPITAATNANGQAVSYISSTLAGTKLVTATAPNLVAGTDTVTFTTLGGCEDDYEWDDSPAEATTVTPPGTTRHNFHDEGDTDWVRFWGYEGITYTIQTMNLAISGTKHVDTKLIFYWWDGSGLVHLATHDDDGDELFADKIVWPITTTDWYYVNVGHVEGWWSFSGCDAYYDLRISGPSAYVYLPIILKDHPPLPPTPIPPPPPGACYPLVETSITVGNDPRGVAYNSDDNLIYVANYGHGTVSVIDGVTYDVIQVITGVVGANGVAYDGTHNLVYVTMHDSAQLAVIDASTNTVSETVSVGNGPNGVAYNPNADKIYVANYISDTVTILDGDTRALVTTVTVPGQTEPAHIAVNPLTDKVYVTYHGSGKVGVIDGDTNAISMIDIYSAGPYGIAVDTVRNLIYVATIDSNRIVAIGEFEGVPDRYLGWAEFAKDQDPAQPAPLRVIAVNPNLGSTGHLYATTVAEDGGFDRFFAIPKGWQDYFERPYAIDVGNNPREGIAVNLSNDRVYVTARGSDKLTVLQDGVPPCLWNFALDFTFTLCRVGIDGDCR